MKLFGLAWTLPEETYEVRASFFLPHRQKWYYPRIEAPEIAVSLLLLQYGLPPLEQCPLPWWIIDFSGHMEKFEGFPQAARKQLPAPPPAWYLKARQIGNRAHAPKGEILPPESSNWQRLWTREEIRSQ